MQTVSLKQHPEIAAIVRAAFPSYKKHNVFLSEFHQTTINSYWDGGSKSYYTIVDLQTMRQKDLPSSTHPFYEVERKGMANSENADVEIDSRGNITLKHLPENFALIEGGTFCGKPATAHIKLNSANLTKLLSA